MGYDYLEQRLAIQSLGQFCSIDYEIHIAKVK